MNLDKIDIKLVRRLSELGEEEKTSTTQLAKDILNPEDRKETIKFNSLITSRLKKLVDYGMVTQEKVDGTMKFYVDEGDVLCPESRLEFESKGEKKILQSSNSVIFPKDEGIYAMMFVEGKDSV